VIFGGSVDDARRETLKLLLERLGRMIHAAVVDSDEVNDCLAELHGDGWDAVMFLEASMLCRRNDDGLPDEEGLQVHITHTRPQTEYRLDAADARWLASIGISPTKHRSQPRRALPPLHQPHPPAHGDG
jgi:hypothetical protein